MKTSQHAVAAAVVSKLEDGNIRAAVRILCSSDKPAREDNNAMEELLSKHPATPPYRPRIPTNSSASPLQLTEEQILQWDGPLTRKEATTLLADCTDEYNPVRLRAATAAHAGDWLLALPLYVSLRFEAG